MYRYIRVAENQTEIDLKKKGWTMAGLCLWRHVKFGRKCFTEQEAINTDVSDYVVIASFCYPI